MEIKLLRGDCLELLKDIPDQSIDMVLCDLPYGVLRKSNPGAKWDSLVDFDKLWEQYKRITKDNAAIILFGSGMFTSRLMQSNKKMWRYNLVWDKVLKGGFLNANRQPLRQHEDICVFYKRLPTYNPQMEKCPPHKRNHTKGNMRNQYVNNCYGEFKNVQTSITDEKYPTSIISIPKEHSIGRFYHPAQKPVALLEYLINTFSNEGDVVLDNCMGSGSTGVACVNTGRNFVGMEIEEKYFDIARKRIEEAKREYLGAAGRSSYGDDRRRTGGV